MQARGTGSAWRGPVSVVSALLVAGLVAGVVAYRQHADSAAALRTYRQIRWPQLLPADWDQFKRMREFKIDRLRDSDPRAQQLLSDTHTACDAAPVVETLDGQPVQIAGYVVPLGSDPRGLTEMLLVPYEGACIHTPPPPANQVIHVTLAKPQKGLRMMDNVLIQGVIKA